MNSEKINKSEKKESISFLQTIESTKLDQIINSSNSNLKDIDEIMDRYLNLKKKLNKICDKLNK